MFGAKYSRMKFWIIWILLAIPVGILDMIDTYGKHSENPPLSGILILGLIIITLLILMFNTLANRIRDYGSNPWIALLSIIPLLGMGVVLYYGIVKHKSL